MGACKKGDMLGVCSHPTPDFLKGKEKAIYPIALPKLILFF
jgi:hypothetical protein